MLESKIKVIIADDYPVYRDGLGVTLRKQKFISTILHASNGEEVLGILKHIYCEIVLMDIDMKPMNGIEATELIRKDFPDVKIIILSSHKEERYVRSLLAMGVSGYLLKNAEASEIIQAISDVHEGMFYFSKSLNSMLITRVINNNFQPTDMNAARKEKLREVIFLMSHEKKTEEIAELLHIPRRTVEDYRRNILRMTKSKNIVGVVKYALKSGISDDEILNARFKKDIVAGDEGLEEETGFSSI